MRKHLLILSSLFIFVGCQQPEPEFYVENTLYKNNLLQTTTDTTNTINEEKKEVKNQPIITPEEYKAMLKEEELANEDVTTIDMEKAFRDFYDEWKHVRYRLGGNSKRGIDCSAFTQRVYKEKFGKKIPRTTWTQVKVGKHVKKSELMLGDLIFFKTGRRDRHVGIYMGDGTFMHASIKGVKYTKVNKPFYKRTYWTSRRIID